MNQLILILLWHRNRIAVARGASLSGVTCVADSFEETITYRGRTWHRAAGALFWREMKPLRGNLPT